MTITVSGSISTPATISSSIAGVYMSNTTLSAGNSTIGGLGLSNALLTASGITVNGAASITSATTISGLLTVSAAQVQNALNVSGLGTVSNLTVLGSLSANTMYSTSTIQAGGVVNISGLATISGAQIQNGLNVSGLGTLSNLTVLGSLSANTIYSTSTIQAGGVVNISGLATISAAKILSNLSISGTLYGTTANIPAITGLSNINSIPFVGNSTNSNILFGSGVVNLCGTNIVAIGSTAALNNSGAYVTAFGTSAGASNTGANLIAIGSNAGTNNIGDSNVFIGATTGQNNSGSSVIGLGGGAAFLNSNSNVIAIGCNAGRANGFSNTVFLGNTATGYSGPSQADSFTVYSTNTTIPFLFGDLSGRQLGIGTNPSAALDVNGSGIFSGSVTASSAFFQTFTVSGISRLGSLNVSGAINVSGLSTLSSTMVIGTLSATTLYAPTINTTTLSAGGLSTFSNVNVTNTLSAFYLFSSNSTITTLSTTTLSVSGTLTNTTLNVCGLATISGASITNTLTSSNIVSTIGTVTTLSVATFSVSGISTLSGVSVTSTLSSVNLFSSNGFVNTLSALTASISGAFNVSGLSTLSNVNVQNTLSSTNLFSSNGLITSLSAATANISGAFSVSGVSTLSNVTVTNTLSAFYLFSSNAYMTTLSATTLGVIGNLTVSAVAILPSLSGLVRLNNVPVLLNDLSQYISFGVSLGVRGLYVNSIGYSAALGNTGSYVNAIGCNAALNNSGSYLNALGYNAGSSNIGANLTSIGQAAGLSNKGDSVVAIGEGACSTNSGSFVVAIGSNAGWSNSGSNVIGIGVNAGQYNTGGNSIFIGRNAGSNNQYSNSIIIGTNPSGYAATAPNTLLIYATTSYAPFLQGDLSGILLGIGKAPTAALDVSGSSIISQTLTVSGLSTLSAARVVNGLNVSGLTTLSGVTMTSTFTSRGVATLSSLVTQGTLSSSNIYVSGGIALGTNAPLVMNGVFSNQATTTLADTTVTRLNAVTWPSVAGTVGQSLTISSDSGIAYWAPFPLPATLSGWWLSPPNAQLYMNNQQITSLSGINGVRLNFNGTSNLMGIGANTLSGTTGNDIIAIGLSAGVGSSGSNLIYLGSNPGGTQAYNDRFTVYSTTSGLPFLQGDVANMFLGIGKSPSTPLDVSGSVAISQNLNVTGLATLPNTVATTLSATTLYASTALNTSGTATLNAVNIPTTLGVTGTTTLGTTNTGTLTATSLASTGTITSAGLSTLNSAIVSTTLNVIGNTTLTTLNAAGITGTTIGSTGTATLNTVTVGGTLGVTGQTTLGNAAATSLVATTLSATSALNAGSATATLGTTTVNTILNVCGAANLFSAILSQNLTVCGQTLFKNLSFATLNGLTWNSPTPASGSTVLSVDSTGKILTWAALTTIGVQNWAQSVANSTLSMQGYGIAGITSFNNISAVFISASAQIGLGAGVLSNNFASNIVAFGTGAGAVGLNTTGVGPNNIFLGSNPGGSSNVSNSLVVYSQTAGSPLIYGDLSNNQVAIAGQSTGGYTLNVGGSAQVITLNVTNSSILSYVTVTGLSNSGITTLGGTVNIPGTNTLNVSGLSTLSSTTITAALSAQSVYVSNGFGVGGTTILAGTVNIPQLSALNVSGQATLSNVNILSTLSAQTAYVSNGLGIGGTVNVGGQSVFSSKVGIGGASPTYTLDIQTTNAGSNGIRIAQNNATNVTAGLYLEAGLGGANTTGNQALVSFSTLGGGGGSVVQSLFSLYEGGNYGLSFKGGNISSGTTVVRVDTGNNRLGVGTVSPGTTLDVSGTFRATGTSTLSGVTVNSINGVAWPTVTSAPVYPYLMALQASGSAAWVPIGAAESTGWAYNPALQTVNMAGFGLTGLSSINGLTSTICSVTNQIGLGANTLSNNTAANIVAFGSNAGSNSTTNSTFSNCIYLGSNPGTSATGSNTFLVYSTTAGTPAIQVNTGSNWLGVGKAPTVALDVVGAGQVTGQFTTQGKLLVGNFSANTCNYAVNIMSSGTRTGFITWSCNTNQVPYMGLGWDQTVDGLVISSGPGAADLGTVNSFFVSRNTGFVGIGKTSASFPLDVSGQINTNTAVSTPSLAVSASTTLSGSLTLPTIASSTYASKVLSYNSTTGAVTQSTLNLGTLGGADSNTMNANWVTTGGGLVTWNATTGVVSGNNRILAIPVNNAMATDGYFNIAEGAWSITMNGWSAAYFVPNSVPSTYPAANGSIKVIPYQSIANQVGSNWIFICSTYADVTPMTLKWGPGFITIPSGGVFNSATGGTSWNVLGQATNIALGSNSSITGTTSIVIGSNATSSVAANNVIAIGTNAGSNLENFSNTIYIGSNAGYRPGKANTLVVQSLVSTLPTLQADLSNRWLGIGIAPSNALDVSGTIRATGPVISTLNISGITVGSSLTLTTDVGSTYFSLMTVASTITVTLPTTAPPTGTYWVIKNNSPVNYTLTSVNGVFNAGSNTYYLQSGIGTSLAYSGTQVGGSNAYYTF
jgi:hypothetical protein